MKRFFFVILLGLTISKIGGAKSLDSYHDTNIERTNTVTENMAYEKKRAQFLSARQSLKDYGLVACLSDIDNNKSKLRDDLNMLMSQYTNNVNRRYFTPQELPNSTLTEDPYEAAHNYMTQHKSTYKSMVLEVGEIKSGGCFQVYHSAAYAYFIESQDKYMNF